jgi:hypothetical protein
VGRAFFPLDEELALLPSELSPGLVESAARLGTWLPFGPAAALLAHFTGTDVSQATVRRLTEGAGAAHVAVQTAAVEALERELPEAPEGPAVLLASVDGAMVPLRGKDTWAEVKTLALGVVAPAERDPRTGEPRVRTEELTYFSRRADHATFARLATVETQRRGMETAGVVCAVADGADWCQSFVDLHRPDAVRILDFPHAVGHLATAAQATFGTASAAWLETQAHTLRHGEPEDVLAALRALPLQDAADPVAAAVARDGTLQYLERRRDQIRYATFAALGYPIGSGCVESANKLVVEARLKGAGMHWAPEQVDPLLALRTVACSDRWAEAWPQLATEWRAAARRRRRRQHRAAPGAAAPRATLQPVSRRARLPEPLRRLPASSTPTIVGGRPTATHPWKRRPLLSSGRHPAHAKS